MGHVCVCRHIYIYIYTYVCVCVITAPASIRGLVLFVCLSTGGTIMMLCRGGRRRAHKKWREGREGEGGGRGNK
jgi:hypothetical protein